MRRGRGGFRLLRVESCRATRGLPFFLVMAGEGRPSTSSSGTTKVVDARAKPGHDEKEMPVLQQLLTGQPWAKPGHDGEEMPAPQHF